jgi:hypothetical protein
MDRLVIRVQEDGRVAVSCDHCDLDELLPWGDAGAFVRGRVAAHVALLATQNRAESHWRVKAPARVTDPLGGPVPGLDGSHLPEDTP